MGRNVFLLFSILLLPATLTAALPVSSGCKEIIKRKSWHALSTAERKAYIDAELCLMWERPATSGFDRIVSRFDDLIKVHQVQSDRIHGDGWFLPFHRLFIWVHEQLLRTECGYTGAHPYWDEPLDAGNFSHSIVFDPDSGFGGDGHGDEGCIRDGPFANYTLRTGPGFSNIDHCIVRVISDEASVSVRKEYVDDCLRFEKFERAWPCIEGRPHGGGHGAVGGEMANPVSSPGDPLFYLHHAFIDRIWWQWQSANLSTRLTDIAGYTRQFALPDEELVLATLDDELNLFGVMSNKTVRETMDIRSSPMCYEYE